MKWVTYILNLTVLCALIISTSLFSMRIVSDADDASRMLVNGLDAYDLAQEPDPLTRLEKYFGLKKRLKTLLAQGANINSCSIDGRYSPLSKAAMRGDLAQCKMLLEFGAYINVTDALYTPLTAALNCPFKKEKEVVINWLLANGADVNFPYDYLRSSPLKIALCQGRKFVPLLLEKGADPLIADEKGENALMYATYCTVKWSWESPPMIILKHLVRKYSLYLRSDLVNFLCIVNRLRSSSSPYERILGSVLFLNRAKIIRSYGAAVPSLREILLKRHQKNRTAYESACFMNINGELIIKNLSRKEDFFRELLNPDKAFESEQIIVHHIREADERAQQEQNRERGCVIQ